MAASHFGLMLRQLRKDRRATLSEVAEGTGISVPMLSRMERGERLPSSETLKALADYYGTSARVLAEAASQQHSLNRYATTWDAEPAEAEPVLAELDLFSPERTHGLMMNLDVPPEPRQTMAPPSRRAAFRARPIADLFPAEPESPTNAVEDATMAAEAAVRQLGRELNRSARSMSPEERERAREEIRRLARALETIDDAPWWHGG